MYVHQKQTRFTYIFGEDKVGLEVPVSILSFWDPVSEGSIGLIPVDAHVTGCIVDQIVHIIPELPGTSSASYSRKWLVFPITANENITYIEIPPHCSCWTWPRIEGHYHWHPPPQYHHDAWYQWHHYEARHSPGLSPEQHPCVQGLHAACPTKDKIWIE